MPSAALRVLSSHVIELASDLVQDQPRAKHLAPTPRTVHLCGKILDLLARQQGITNGQLALDWGVDAKVVARVRGGRAPYTVTRIVRTRKTLAREFLQLCLEAIDASPVIDVHGEESRDLAADHERTTNTKGSRK